MCLLPALAFGQNGGVLAGTPTITNSRGEPVPYATVAICNSNPGPSPATPCGSVGNLASIATDLTLATQCSKNVSPPAAISGTGCTNPGTSDGLGNVVAFAMPGVYYCEYYGGSIVQPIVVPCFFASGGSGGVASGLVPLQNCTSGTVQNETVQLSTLNGSACGTVGAISSTTVIGVCSSGCGNSGIAEVAVQNFQNAILDNAGSANDYVAPSATTAGFLSDTGVAFGSAPPNPPVETCGVIGTPNSGGAGNAANVLLSCLALFGAGPSGTGSVGLCPVGTTPGAIGYYPVIPGTNIACDAQFRTDGHGNIIAVSLGLTGSGAGYMYCVQGAAPALNASNAVYRFCPTSATTYGLAEAGSAGAAGNCWGISSQTTSGGVSTDFMGWLGCSSTVYALQVNGAGLTAGDTVNFNNTTPAAGTNGYELTFQTSKSGTVDSVSAELVGDGNANHFLNGTGAFSTVGNSGLTNNSVTYNGQTVALGSTGNVNSGASAHSVALNQGNGSAMTGANPTSSAFPLVSNGTGSDPTFQALGSAGIANGAVGAAQLASQYSKLRCETGLGDGLNAMAAGTYLQFFCVNDSGVTWTITGIHCWTDNAGTSTLNATNNAGTGLLTGAVTCNNTKASGGAAGTQSATTTLPNGDAVSFTFVADGTSKQTTWTVSLSQ